MLHIVICIFAALKTHPCIKFADMRISICRAVCVMSHSEYVFEYVFVFVFVFAVYTYQYTHTALHMEMRVRKLVTVLVWMCAGTLATEAKTSRKYQNFQVNFYVFKGPATIMRSHRNRKCSSMGKNGKGNCGKMLHFIEHLNVRGEMRCNWEDPDAVYNIIQGWVLTWGLSRHPVIKHIYLIKYTFLNKHLQFTNNLNINKKAYHERYWLASPELATAPKFTQSVRCRRLKLYAV